MLHFSESSFACINVGVRSLIQQCFTGWWREGLVCCASLRCCSGHRRFVFEHGGTPSVEASVRERFSTESWRSSSDASLFRIRNRKCDERRVTIGETLHLWNAGRRTLQGFGRDSNYVYKDLARRSGRPVPVAASLRALRWRREKHARLLYGFEAGLHGGARRCRVRQGTINSNLQGFVRPRHGVGRISRSRQSVAERPDRMKGWRREDEKAPSKRTWINVPLPRRTSAHNNPPLGPFPF